MVPLTQATEKTSMLPACTAEQCPSVHVEQHRNSRDHHPGFPCHDLWKQLSGALNDETRLSRRLVPSSSQLVPQTPLKARPLMMLVFSASTNCTTFGLSFEPQYERIAQNVFSRRSWFRLWAWGHLKPPSFTVLHTCWAAVMSISHPFCENTMKKGS
jgi:hypothetical protein